MVHLLALLNLFQHNQISPETKIPHRVRKIFICHKTADDTCGIFDLVSGELTFMDRECITQEKCMCTVGRALGTPLRIKEAAKDRTYTRPSE